MTGNGYGFHVDTASCIGCKACQIACKDKNGLGAGILWRRVVEVSRGGWTRRGGVWLQQTGDYFLSVACMHCRRPVCVEVCPSRAATQRADGIVLIDTDRCLGCRYCEWACPYGAPRYDKARGVMTKCDLCRDLVDRGEAPACAAACPMRVLEFGTLDDLQRRHGIPREIPPLPARGLTEPSGGYSPHREAARIGHPSPRIANLEEV